MENIKISVTKKIPTVEGTPCIVCGNSSYTITFAFDEEWAKLPVKTARYVYSSGGVLQHQDKPFEGDTVKVPVLSNVREVFVGVFAGDLKTTTPARIPCKLSILCGSGKVEETDQNTYDQIMAILNNLAAGEHTTDAEEHALLGPELISLDGWTADGWTGGISTGYTHTSGNTNSLVYKMPESTAGKRYLISFGSTVAPTTTNLFVRVGNSPLFNLYGQADPISVGVLAPEDGDLEFIPASDFTGTLKNISVRQIVSGFDGCFPITDSNGGQVFSIRAGKASDLDSQNGENNLFIGRSSGQWNASGYGNVALGSEALMNNLSGFWNTALGYKTLEQNTAGSRNIGIGYVALRKNQVGQRNVAIGTHALREHTDGDFNIAIGADSQLEGTQGEGNVGIGTGTLYKNSGGNYNTAIGYSAMGGGAVGSRGDDNIAIGRYAMPGVTGSGNIAIGKQAGYNITNGTYNVVIGANSGKAGTQNVVLGGVCGQNLNQWAAGNVLIGYSVGGSMSGGAYNILIGRNISGESGSSYTYHLNIGNLLRGILVGGTDPHLEVNGGLSLPQIPTADPGVAGRVWNDGGTLKVSTGG